MIYTVYYTVYHFGKIGIPKKIKIAIWTSGQISLAVPLGVKKFFYIAYVT